MRALADWREHDVARAIHAADREAIGATESARALVLELFASPDAPRPAPETGESPRDLYNACAALGRLLAEAGASPTLAVSTIDGARAALEAAASAVDPTRLAAARASIAEAYVAARVDAERGSARRAWEYPACAVRLDRETLAIAAGVPHDDAEALGDWAARVALSASKDGVKVAVLSGDERARAELSSALALVGVEARTHLPPRKESWLRLPWRK